MTAKVQLKIRIEEPLLNQLWDLIRKKHAKPYGALQEEVSHAIAHWISEHGGKVNLRPKNPELPRRHTSAQEIIMALKEQGFLTQCSTSDLRLAIQRVRGIDKRTVHTWHRFLVENHYLKPLGTNVWEIL